MADYDICFCGDIYAEDPSRLAIGDKLSKLLGRCNYVITNLETPIVTSPSFKPMNKYSALKTSPEIIKFLRKMDVSAVSLANNHIMDHGDICANETVKLLNENSIKNYGYGKTIEDAFQPSSIKVGSLNIALVGITTTYAPEALATEIKPGVAGITVITKINVDPREVLEEPAPPYIVGGEIPKENLAFLEKIFSKVKENYDFVIVQIHWGVGLAPYNEVVLDYVRSLGKYLIDIGIDLVVGGHPHTIQPVEIYKNKLIAYSLGNFIFHPIMDHMENKGMILALQLKNNEVSFYFVEQRENKVELLDSMDQSPKLQYFKYQSLKNGVVFSEKPDHLVVLFK